MQEFCMNRCGNLLTLDVGEAIVSTSLGLIEGETGQTVPVEPATTLIGTEIHVKVLNVKVGLQSAVTGTQFQVVEDTAFHELLLGDVPS